MEEKPIAHFIKYNNAVPIVISFLLLGAGGAFAATNPDVQQAVVGATQTVTSADNTYITQVDLNAFPLTIEVKAVTEDAESYYVAYEMHTIDVADYVWKDVAKQKTLVVSKAQLNGGDLGVYVQKQLSEVRASEHERLVETQKIELANGVTQKQVATVYSGLVGKFLDPKEEVFPGYTPVVTEPAPSPNPDVPTNAIPSPTFDANAPIILPPVTPVEVPLPEDIPPSTPPPSAPLPPAVRPPPDAPPPDASSTPPAETPSSEVPPIETSSSTPAVTPPTDTTPPPDTTPPLDTTPPPQDTTASSTPGT